jgi:hypothetical protein
MPAPTKGNAEGLELGNATASTPVEQTGSNEQVVEPCECPPGLIDFTGVCLQCGKQHRPPE